VTWAFFKNEKKKFNQKQEPIFNTGYIYVTYQISGADRHNFD